MHMMKRRIEMEFRKAVGTDVDDMMRIIRQAQAGLKRQGVDQWQDGYPDVETISRDIADGIGYVLVKDGNVAATVAISFDKEKTYDSIYEGEWITSGEYAVIHRIAVDDKFKGTGLASEIIRKAELLCLDRGVHSIKIDTHEDNSSMQRMLEKSNFKYCGVIYLEDGAKRIAFEKTL